MSENKLLKVPVVKNSVNSFKMQFMLYFKCGNFIITSDTNASTSKEMLSGKLVKDSESNSQISQTFCNGNKMRVSTTYIFAFCF